MPRKRLTKTESLLVDHINKSIEFVLGFDNRKAERHYRRAEILLQSLYIGSKRFDLYNEVRNRVNNYREVLMDLGRVIHLQESLPFSGRVHNASITDRYASMTSRRSGF